MTIALSAGVETAAETDHRRGQPLSILQTFADADNHAGHALAPDYRRGNRQATAMAKVTK
ncbi:hypothetical protein NDR87_32445 [Nocardia sp. CDC159]|uniref:Uncharacterized protein n=1 Tax=Nocardia pulmonis TaxID=2951408 RepID=A0A9X2EG31_9NOCA|nr:MULTISPECIES: hypothetical protein [Nocardia]MCM6778203.1 hypothetical protein [Nocardia pulmonis]MCM6791092.1 hypothetical protein [Nocardia sp. CDC159]